MKGIKLIKISKIKSASGTLIFFEKHKEIPFNIKRIFCIYGISKNKERGNHAHKKLKQAMICLSGEIEVKVDDGKTEEKFFLNSPDKLLVITGGHWVRLKALKNNSILCVGASDIYAENDYIKNYKDYLKWLEND